MRKLILVILLSVITFAGAEDINPDINFDVENPENLVISNPKIVSSLDIQFTGIGIINISPKSSTLPKLSLELYSFPQNDYYSKVLSLSTEPESTLKDDYYLFEWRDLPEGETKYTLSSEIKSIFDIKKVTSVQTFPFSNIPEEYEKYLASSEKINSDDPAIKRVANDIVTGETDAFIATYKLAKFVSDEMTYDLDYIGRVNPSTTVLRDKIGVCVEYSNLFMALARSVGIPVRYVSGYAYGNIYGEKFNGHAWTEVWLPNTGWIPFDPTFEEFGWVDMTHIKTQVSEGPTEPSLKLIWLGGEVLASEPETNVELKSKKENLPVYIKNQMWVEEKEIGFDSYNIIWMSLENVYDFYLVPEVYLTSSPKIIGENQKSVILLPKNSALVGWIIELPDNLNTKFKYTYTIQGSALFGGENEVEFIVNPDYDKKLTIEEAKDILGVEEITSTADGFTPELNIGLRVPALAYFSENFTVAVDITNIGNAPVPDLKVCLEDTAKKCEKIYIGINDKQTLTFSELAENEGKEKLFLTFSGEGVEESHIVEIEVRKRTLIERISKFISELLTMFRK